MIYGWNSNEVQIGNYYCDGYAVVDDVRYVFEYNGCRFHDCDLCETERANKTDEQWRKGFFESLKNTKVIVMTSCQWSEKKKTLDYDPGISPLLYKKKLRMENFIPLILTGEIYGFMIVDLSATEKAERFRKINWPPIFKKEEILYDDLPAWMQKITDEREFPKETIVQKMHARKILLHTDLLKFYLEQGFRIDVIHKFYEYEGRKCFGKVFKNVYEARVEATKTKDDENATDEMKAAADMKATAVKLVSNSMYGQLLLVRSIFFNGTFQIISKLISRKFPDRLFLGN